MSNVITDFKDRLKIDYTEWRNYLISKWNVKREKRLIRRAMHRAQEKNYSDGRTYYILKDKQGGINEFNSSDIKFWTKYNVLDKMDLLQRLEKSIAVVTSNKNILNQYNQIQLKKEGKDHE